MPGYGTPLGLTLPVIGGTQAAAAQSINTALSAIIARLESKVSAADLSIDADVSFKAGAVFSGITDLQRAAFASLSSALTAGTNPNTAYVLNGNLHFIDGAGNLVQITSNGAVNVSTTGGITGAGYGIGGVEFNWDSGNTRFSARSGAGADDYADVQCADLLLRDASGNAIRFQAPAIASDYSLSLPSALPASTSLLQVTSTGLMQTTLAPTGLTGVTLASGGHVTLSGAGELKHGNRVLMIPASAASAVGGPTHTSIGSIGLIEAGDFVLFPLPLAVGDRIISVTLQGIFTGAGTRTLALRRRADAGADTNVSAPTSTTTGDTAVVYNVADTVIAANNTYYLRFTTTTASSDDVFGIYVTYDRP